MQSTGQLATRVQAHLEGRAAQPGLVDFELGRMKDDLPSGAADVEVDRHLPLEGEALEIRLESHPVGPGEDVGRKPVLGGFTHKVVLLIRPQEYPSDPAS